MGIAMSDGDEVEAIASSHLSPMDFSGNCHAPTHVTGPSCKLSDITSWRPMMVLPILVGTLAMWPRGHISNRMRSASFGLRLQRQCERGSLCTLLPDQLDFARGRRRMHGAVHGRRDPRVRSRARISGAARRAWGRRMRCWSVTMAVVFELALRGTSLAADPRFPDWPCNQIKVPEISVA